MKVNLKDFIYSSIDDVLSLAEDSSITKERVVEKTLGVLTGLLYIIDEPVIEKPSDEELDDFLNNVLGKGVD